MLQLRSRIAFDGCFLSPTFVLHLRDLALQDEIYECLCVCVFVKGCVRDEAREREREEGGVSVIPSDNSTLFTVTRTNL